MQKQLKTSRSNVLHGVGATLAAALIAGFSPAVLAQPVATMNNFTYAGSGCPAGSAQAAVINAGKILRVTFQAFKVAMNGNIGTPMAACEISVFVTAPAKHQLEISPAQYNGAYSARAQIAVSAGHIWAKKKAGPWAGGAAGTAGSGAAGVYKFTNPNKTAFVQCGGKDELKDDGAAGIRLTINPADMVSADLKFVDYMLNYAPCQGGPNGGDGKGPAG